VTFGRFSTTLGALCVLGIGGAALRWPQASTRSYGVPNDDPDAHAYVRAAAARDLVMGGFVLWAALANDRAAMQAGLLVCTIAPLADALLAYERRGAVPQLGIHALGVVGVLATWLIVHNETPDDG
jgi:hypothetical protein